VYWGSHVPPPNDLWFKFFPVNRIFVTAARTMRYVGWDPEDYWDLPTTYWHDVTDPGVHIGKISLPRSLANFFLWRLFFLVLFFVSIKGQALPWVPVINSVSLLYLTKLWPKLCSIVVFLFSLSYMWFGRVTIRTFDCDQQVVGSTAGRVAIKWLLLRWVTVCGQINHLGI